MQEVLSVSTSNISRGGVTGHYPYHFAGVQIVNNLTVSFSTVHHWFVFTRHIINQNKKQHVGRVASLSENGLKMLSLIRNAAREKGTLGPLHRGFLNHANTEQYGAPLTQEQKYIHHNHVLLIHCHSSYPFLHFSEIVATF